jgi:hypothetical protein
MGSPIAISFSILTYDNNSVAISGFPDNISSNQVIMNFDNQGNQLWQINTWTSLSIANYGGHIMTMDSGQAVILLDNSGNIIKKIIMPDIIASNDYIYYICQNKNSGNYYMVGTNKNFSFTGWTVFVYDSNLNFIRSFPVTDNIYGYVQSAFVQNGNIYLARWRYGSGVVSNKISDVYKYDSLGNLIWTKTLLDYDNPYIIQGDDGIYFASRKYYVDSLATIGSVKWEIAKLDSSTGNSIWSKEWKGSETGQFETRTVNGVLGSPDGGCLAFGCTNKTGQHDVYNPLVISYSAQGDSLFSIEPTESSSWGDFELGTWDNNHALILSGSIDGVCKIWKYSISGITAVKHESSEVPEYFSLSQNYPNPFNPTTTINYSLAKEGNVKLTVYNAIGSKVATIVNEYKSAGTYSVKFNGSNLASGIYLYRLESGNYSEAKKFILMK